MDWSLRPESRDLLYLDFLRIVASLGIVTVHALPLLPGKPEAAGLSLFVDMFFTISGYVIAYTSMDRLPAGYGRFLQKRAARLLPLHYGTLAIYAAVGVAVAHGLRVNGPERFDLACLPAYLLMLHAAWGCAHPTFNNPSWSIAAETLMYLGAPIIFWLVRANWHVAIAFVVGLWLALFLLSTPDDQWFLRTAQGGAIRALPSFLFGVVLFWCRDRLPGTSVGRWGVWLCLGIFTACAVVEIRAAWLVLLVWATVFFAAAACRGNVSRAFAVAAGAGQLTYSTYMLHDLLFLSIISVVGERLLHAEGALKIAIVGAAFLTVWPIGYLSLVLFERPTRRLINRLGRKIGPI